MVLSSGATRSQPPVHPPRRRKNHRGGKKKKSRRKSFAAPPEDIAQDILNPGGLVNEHEGFYSRIGHNLSNTSLDSEALLDHRCVFNDSLGSRLGLR